MIHVQISDINIWEQFSQKLELKNIKWLTGHRPTDWRPRNIPFTVLLHNSKEISFDPGTIDKIYYRCMRYFPFETKNIYLWFYRF